ncbi:MAG: hypothetical protein QNK37_12445 [Acidobacteriota bacterium]|nr:hypothetical protein [Acidobacteriota bacterium]
MQRLFAMLSDTLLEVIMKRTALLCLLPFSMFSSLISGDISLLAQKADGYYWDVYKGKRLVQSKPLGIVKAFGESDRYLYTLENENDATYFKVRQLSDGEPLHALRVDSIVPGFIQGPCQQIALEENERYAAFMSMADDGTVRSILNLVDLGEQSVTTYNNPLKTYAPMIATVDGMFILYHRRVKNLLAFDPESKEFSTFYSGVDKPILSLDQLGVFGITGPTSFANLFHDQSLLKSKEAAKKNFTSVKGSLFARKGVAYWIRDESSQAHLSWMVNGEGVESIHSVPLNTASAQLIAADNDKIFFVDNVNKTIHSFSNGKSSDALLDLSGDTVAIFYSKYYR